MLREQTVVKRLTIFGVCKMLLTKEVWQSIAKVWQMIYIRHRALAPTALLK